MNIEEVWTKWSWLRKMTRDQHQAIELMLKCGWDLTTVTKKGQRHYSFQLGDPKAWGMSVSIPHAQLTTIDVAKFLESREDDLRESVNKVRQAWITAKLSPLPAQAPEPTGLPTVSVLECTDLKAIDLA